MTQIRAFGVGQTAKVVAVIYLFLGLIGAVVFIPLMMMMNAWMGMEGAGGAGGTGISVLMLILFPIGYAIAAWIATAIACLVYNFAASKVGGVAIDLEG
jgi:hypothetical protein